MFENYSVVPQKTKHAPVIALGIVHRIRCRCGQLDCAKVSASESWPAAAKVDESTGSTYRRDRRGAQSPGTHAGSVDLFANAWNAAFAFSEDDRARIELALPAGRRLCPAASPMPNRSASPRTALATRWLLFLNGQARKLTPTLPAQVQFLDEQLDRWQREAAAKALATPDIFLLRGDPGSGKSRVVLELLRQEIGRGHRILFLS